MGFSGHYENQFVVPQSELSYSNSSLSSLCAALKIVSVLRIYRWESNFASFLIN